MNRQEPPRTDAARQARPAPVRPAAGPMGGWLSWNGAKPGPEATWLVAYAALFLIRPWELKPELAFLPMERIMAIVMLLRLLFLPQLNLRIRTAGWASLIFLGAATAASATALTPKIAFDELETLAKIYVFGFCILLTIRRRVDLRAFLLGWIGTMFFFQVKALWEYYVYGRGEWRMGIWRLIGINETFADPNGFANTSVLLLPLIVAVLRCEPRRWLRWLLGAGVVLGAFVILKTGSRGGLVALMIFGVVALARSRRKLFGVAVIVAAVIVAVSILPPRFLQRYESLIDREADSDAEGSSEGRRECFRKAIELYKLRPVLGVGLANFVIADEFFPLTHGWPGLRPHNLLGQLLAETGTVGTAAFVFFVGALFWLLAATRRRARDDPDPLLFEFSTAGMLVVVLLLWGGISGHNLVRFNWYWLLGLACAAATIRATEAPSAQPR